ncbi:hypothetical protein NHQ30_001763 [Ciborinia camelliae]|nr:hypothetical protein NHQ30_001763 [Ciborinia camelliae]
MLLLVPLPFSFPSLPTSLDHQQLPTFRNTVHTRPPHRHPIKFRHGAGLQILEVRDPPPEDSPDNSKKPKASKDASASSKGKEPEEYAGSPCRVYTDESRVQHGDQASNGENSGERKTEVRTPYEGPAFDENY